MKSPRQIRSDMRTLASHVSQVREALLRKSDVAVAQIGKECRRTADALGDVLKTQQLPDNYKVAVVGRFKTGKSSFVNELLAARLASEDTNPETAAITTFRHGPRVKASVRFVSQEEWDKLQKLYAEDPKHIDAHRVKLWQSFAKPRKGKDGETDESFDLPALERQFLMPGGHTIEIELNDESTKKAETEFRRQLKEFTSGAKPHHCLVQSIDIASPSPILDEGVLLIDTPGLDDTERFRVSLTEKAVEDVDAILFLTKSGESYSQSDKDFLLTLLRKGTVKQLIVVVTQLDVTYQQHLDNAEANDEVPESLALRIEREHRRLGKELAATLADLGQDDSPTMRRYREQLGEVEIAFTSAKLHRDWKANKHTVCTIDPADPGGVEKLYDQLLRLLSTESRLALVAQRIAADSRAVLLELQEVLAAKLIALRDIKDKEVAEQTLSNFRLKFGQACQQFEGAVAEKVDVLRKRLRVHRSQHAMLHENISLLAESELAAFEANDVGRHWRTRRSGYWGYMAGLQTRVANRIFPKVQQMLGDYTDAFAAFAKAFEAQLSTLSNKGAAISEGLDLGATLPFDLTRKLKSSLERSMSNAQQLISDEELRVTSLLDDFIDDKVSDRIDQARTKVSNIWGTGTTHSQSAEVQGFYHEVKRLLSDALMNHVRERGQNFGDFLVGEAEAAPRDAMEEVAVLLEQAADNIRAATTAAVADQKGAAEKLVAEVEASNSEVLSRAEKMLQDLMGADEPSTKLGELPPTKSAPLPSTAPAPAPTSAEQSRSASVVALRTPEPEGVSETEGDWAEQVQQRATVTLDRLCLRDGETGWPFDKIFAARYLEGALKVRLVDPYLHLPHQLRNLNAFLLHVAETAHPRELEIVTGFAPTENAMSQERAIDDATRDLFTNYGVALTFHRDSKVHDRFVIMDHGVLFTLGRGLDIYKPATGLAVYRLTNRKVRQTRIDVFCRPGHPLDSVP